MPLVACAARGRPLLGRRRPVPDLDAAGPDRRDRLLEGPRRQDVSRLVLSGRRRRPGALPKDAASRDEIEGYRSRGVEILGVSFDAPEANAAFVRCRELCSRLLSDTDRALATRRQRRRRCHDGDGATDLVRGRPRRQGAERAARSRPRPTRVTCSAISARSRSPCPDDLRRHWVLDPNAHLP